MSLRLVLETDRTQQQLYGRAKKGLTFPDIIVEKKSCGIEVELSSKKKTVIERKAKMIHYFYKNQVWVIRPHFKTLKRWCKAFEQEKMNSSEMMVVRESEGIEKYKWKLVFKNYELNHNDYLEQIQG